MKKFCLSFMLMFGIAVMAVMAQPLPEYTPLAAKGMSPLQIACLVADNIVDRTNFQYEYVVQPVYPDIEAIDFGESLACNRPTVAYALSTLFSEAEQTETVEIGRTCGVKIWVNDQLVYSQAGHRELPVQFDEKTYVLPEKFEVRLQKGANKILVKAIGTGTDAKQQVLLQSPNMGRYAEKGKKITCSLKQHAPKVTLSNWLLLGPFDNPDRSPDVAFEPETTIVFHRLYRSGGKTFTWDIPRIHINTDNPDAGKFYAWSYHVGNFIWGLQRLSRITSDPKYADYAARWCEYTLNTLALADYQTKELHAVRSMNWGTAGRPMLDYTTAPSMPFMTRLVDEDDFPLREKYAEYAEKIMYYIADEQFRLSDGTLARQYTGRPSVWADDMFMGLPYMLYSALYTSDPALRKRLMADAANQIILFNKYLFKPDAGLYMQANYPDLPQKIPFWSRGNGWAIWATTEVLLHTPKNDRNYMTVMEIYRKHVDGLVKVQDADGYWHNILDMPETVREASGTAIFTLALARGINNGWLERQKYLPALEKAWTALLTFIGDDGNLYGVKGGTNFSPDTEDYARTPFVKSDTHGILPLLFACMEMEQTRSILMQAQTPYDITKFGAKGDDRTINTVAIQKAIDKCSIDGGGQVLIPNGIFVTGTIRLKSNVTLYLNEGAELKAVGDMDAFPGNRGAMIHAYRQDNIGIAGKGTINGHGDHPAFQSDDLYNGLSNRPFTILLSECTNVRLKEFTLMNGTFWCIKLLQCNNTTVDDINVISRVVANNDGLDITDCYNTRVANCFFDCGDDAICPKSESPVGVKKLVITNCILKSESNGIKFGTASRGGFEDVAISNCHIYDTRLSGIALELVDGGVFDRIVINNITMHNVNGGLFIKLGHRNGDTPGILRNVTVTNLIADGIGLWEPDTTAAYFKTPKGSPKIGMCIAGQPGYMVENVTLQNIYMQFAGGGTHDDAQHVMDDTPKAYPEYTNFGITPAYAYNCRHVKNVRFDNVRFEVANEDARPALFFEDAEGVNISGFEADISGQASCFVRCKDVRNLFVHDCKPQSAAIPFLLFEGKADDITIMNNDFRKVREIYRFKDEAAGKEIDVTHNMF